MANDCSKHIGMRGNPRYSYLEDIMKNLPENQGGAGRHKCPYCAYEKGFERGLQRAVEKLRDCIMDKSS